MGNTICLIVHFVLKKNDEALKGFILLFYHSVIIVQSDNLKRFIF